MGGDLCRRRRAEGSRRNEPGGGLPRPVSAMLYLEAVLPGLVTGGEVRTRPRIAHALPAPVIAVWPGVSLPPGAVGRVVIGQEPSARCVLTRKPCARAMAGSLGLIPVWDSAYSAWPVAQASLAMPFAWLQPPSAFCRSL